MYQTKDNIHEYRPSTAIVRNLPQLTSLQLAEVLNFVKFLRFRQPIVQPMPDMIDTLCGKYEHRLSSSTVFARQKQEDIRREDEKWQRI
jgi:hypothetical protein